MGIFLIVWPIVLLPLVLVLLAISNFIFTALMMPDPVSAQETVTEVMIALDPSSVNGSSSGMIQPYTSDNDDLAASSVPMAAVVINAIISLLGILSLLGIFISVPIGIAMLAAAASDKK